MISSIDIKNKYIELYSNLRNYLWDYKFVCALIDLEDAVLQRFPNEEDVKRKLELLRYLSSSCRREDKDLDQVFTEFLDMINNETCDYSYLIVNIKE